MSVERTAPVAETFTHTCDACRVRTHLSPSESRPSGWTMMIFEQGAQDYQGSEVADATTRRLLCPDCRTEVAKTCEAEMDRLMEARDG